jgi:hypothetical protein
MAIFVRLVDSNATVKSFTQALGLTKPEIELQMQSLGKYRNYMRVFEEIKTIRKSDMSPEQQKEAIIKLRQSL